MEKEYNFGGERTISFSLNTNISSEQIISENDKGEHLICLGGIGNNEFESLKKCQSRISDILLSTIEIEKKLEDIISNYLFGKISPVVGGRLKSSDNVVQHNFFKREILQSSSFQFSFKKSLLNKLSNELDISGKMSSKLQGALKEIMTWRNAFAHGHLIYKHPQGVFLNYYSGEQKQQLIDCNFWEKLESNFNFAHQQLNFLLEA